MQIQISWLLQKPTDLDLHCLQRYGCPGSAGQGLIHVLLNFFAHSSFRVMSQMLNFSEICLELTPPQNWLKTNEKEGTGGSLM